MRCPRLGGQQQGLETGGCARQGFQQPVALRRPTGMTHVVSGRYNALPEKKSCRRLDTVNAGAMGVPVVRSLPRCEETQGSMTMTTIDRSSFDAPTLGALDDVARLLHVFNSVLGMNETFKKASHRGLDASEAKPAAKRILKASKAAAEGLMAIVRILREWRSSADCIRLRWTAMPWSRA